MAGMMKKTPVKAVPKSKGKPIPAGGKSAKGGMSKGNGMKHEKSEKY